MAEKFTSQDRLVNNVAVIIMLASVTVWVIIHYANIFETMEILTRVNRYLNKLFAVHLLDYLDCTHFGTWVLPTQHMPPVLLCGILGAKKF